MEFTLTTEPFSQDLSRYLLNTFAQQAIDRVGVSKNEQKITCLVLRDEQRHLIGLIAVQKFWGSLMIPYLFVEESFRGRGIGKQLLDQAIAYARAHGCRFLTAESSSYEAPTFYTHHGFTTEFTRTDFDHDVTVHYFRLDLT